MCRVLLFLLLAGCAPAVIDIEGQPYRWDRYAPQFAAEPDWPDGPRLDTPGVSALLNARYDDVLIWQDGALRFSLHAGDSGPHVPRNVASVAKTFLSLALGAAIQDGVLTLDTPLTTIGGCRVPDVLRPLTPRHLITMGFGADVGEEPALLGADNLACATLARPVEAANGSRFRYSSYASALLGQAIADATGQPYEDYVQRRVFAPLGITLDGWLRRTSGPVEAGAFMAISPHDMVRLGMVFLPSEESDFRSWVPIATRKAWREEHYAMGVWLRDVPGLSDPAVTALGFGGHKVIALPSKNAVIVVSFLPSAEDLAQQPLRNAAVSAFLRAVAPSL